MEPAIRAEALGKSFVQFGAARPNTLRAWLQLGWKSGPGRPFWALRDVGFEVAPGEMFGVVGRNGSGKSTLLRLLGGVMRPDEGRVSTRFPVSGILELNTGMHPDLSGRENALINGVVLGLGRKDVERRLDAISEFSELGSFFDEPVRTYSSGMKLRLGFAVAVSAEPRILIIDEVLAVGDEAFQAKCLDRIQRFRAAGCAIVLISHDLHQVKSNCDRALWLNEGTVMGVGKADEVVQAYRASSRGAPAAAPQAAEEGTSALVRGKNRLGTQDAEVVDVAILDGDGAPADLFNPGDALTIAFRIEAVQPVKAHMSVTIQNAEGLTCFDTNTELDQVELRELRPGTGVALAIRRLDLAPGRYRVSLGIFHPSWSHPFDFHSMAYPLVIAGRRHPLSVIDPPRSWRIDGVTRR